MNEFWLIGGMAAITFTVRYIVLGMCGQVRLPVKLIHLLRYVPPAVLTAIVFPEVFIAEDDTLFLSIANPRLIGAIAAVLVSYSTKNLLLTIAIGMLAFYVI